VSQDASGRVRTPLEPFVLAATLAVIPVLIVEWNATGGWNTAARIANWVIWLVFAAELAVILFVAERKRAALRAHRLDAAVVIVTVPLVTGLLASLRLVRLARLLRLTRAGLILARAIQAERALSSGTAFKLIALITLFIVVVAGSAQAAFDANEFPSVWDGIWWATVTVMTVGYGDLYPKDVEGRIIGIVVMLVGIGFLSVLTATVATHFVSGDVESEASETRAALERIEAELAEIKARLPAPTS
jgi:voltage-gated potassium channel